MTAEQQSLLLNRAIISIEREIKEDQKVKDILLMHEKERMSKYPIKSRSKSKVLGQTAALA